MIFVTGGLGFIGSNFILDWFLTNDEPLLNIDALTYAGNKENLSELSTNDKYIFIEGNILDRHLLDTLFQKYTPRAVVHFAAESHVDRSIQNSHAFLQTNVEGTYNLLQASRNYWTSLNQSKISEFKFLHISTDEVYGSLNAHDAAFSETTPYAPNSPYSASKAASDYFVRAWHHTYGLPTLTTNCSNNYGPYQYPEKLIPLVLMNAILGKPLPIYGDGSNIRDWLYVKDHCAALRTVLQNGKIGETYNIGGCNEKTNLEVVRTLCDILDKIQPKHLGSYHDQIVFVKDRLGHDKRYAIDSKKIMSTLGWLPKETFQSGIQKTVSWYLNHKYWVNEIHARQNQSPAYEIMA